MKKILYVVHRYAPYPGGSENFVKNLAEETLRRGNEVAVFSGCHKGDQNGVRVTNNVSIFNEKWDLVVVHGGDVDVQNFVLYNIKNLPYPVLYLLIKPSESEICLRGMHDASWLGCGSTQDWNHVTKYKMRDKSVYVPFSINPSESIGREGFKKKYDIKTSKMFVSCGGFWPHKAMRELANLFEKANLSDTTLVLTGYDNSHNCMPTNSDKIKSLMLENRDDVLSAIREADLYIMHSYEEGFGLVLLEAIINETPWAARNIAGAEVLKSFGFTYNTDNELIDYIKTFCRPSDDKILTAKQHVLDNHSSKNTVDSILEILKK